MSDQKTESQVEIPPKLTVHVLKKQVDELFEDFNKLALTLNLPKVTLNVKQSVPAESIERLNDKPKVGLEWFY